MPIEIKELVITIKVKEPSNKHKTLLAPNGELKKMKSEIIKECSQKIMDILKQKQRR